MRWGEHSWSGSKCLSLVRRSFFPHVFVAPMQGRINKVGRILVIFSLHQAERRDFILRMNTYIQLYCNSFLLELHRSLVNDIDKDLGMSLAANKNEWTEKKIHSWPLNYKSGIQWIKHHKFQIDLVFGQSHFVH